MKRKIARRTVLRGLGASIALPFLDVMQRSAASDSPTKRTNRMAYLYFPNGVADGAWQPTKTDRNGNLVDLNPWMKPLQPFASDIIIPQKVWTPKGNGHRAGTATWLTGEEYDAKGISAGGVSVDQLAASTVGQQTLLPSLELSLKGEGYFSNSLPRNTLSWKGNDTPAPRDIEPRAIFDRMFLTNSSTLSKRSVLDLVLADAKALKKRVSANDKKKVDEYLDSIRSIERRLEFADTQAKRAKNDQRLSASLIRPAAGIPDDHETYMRLMFDMIVLAFWADATRVCTFMLDHGQSNRYFSFVDNVKGTWHALSHWRDASGKTEDDDGKTSWSSREEKRDMYNRVTTWHHRQVAYFLGKLKSIQEPHGTLLDNSMILYGSNLADGHAHAAKNLPILLAGGGAGTIQSGRQIKFSRDTSLSNLHLSMLHRMGIERDSFGGSSTSMSEIDKA